MSTTLPTTEEVEQINSYMEHIGITSDHARAYIYKKFAAGDVSIETLPAFCAIERIDNPRALGLAPVNGAAGGHAANSAAAAAAASNGTKGADGADHGADNTPAKNPWMLAADDPVGIARRTEVIKSLGTRVAAGFAKAANVDLAARPLKIAAVA